MKRKSKWLEEIHKSIRERSPRTSVRSLVPATLPGANGHAGLQQAAGNLALQRLFRSGVVQAKLTIGSPDDPLEREADRVADQVSQMKPAPCQCGGDLIQRKTRRSSNGYDTASLGRSLNSSNPGQPLDPATRAFMEPRLGYDFSYVRVHTDPKAAESARTVNALAFTVGRDIVFGGSHYAPRTMQGRRLLAHELAHVVQQASDARLRTRWSLESALYTGVDVLSPIVPLRPGRGISSASADTDGGNIGYVQRQTSPQSAAEVERSRHESMVETDAFDLCVAAHALGFIPTVAEAVVEETSRTMQAAVVHRVSTMREFEAVVEQYSAALLLANPPDRERWREHHRRNLVNYSISGQTVGDSVLGDVHIVIVGSHSLLSAQKFVERHERGHLGLTSLGVPVAQHHGILQMLGLGIDRMPHLGIRVRL